MQWHTPVIPATQEDEQKDHKNKASLGYILRSCLKKKIYEKYIPFPTQGLKSEAVVKEYQLYSLVLLNYFSIFNDRNNV
jgi:hypothetical protein